MTVLGALARQPRNAVPHTAWGPWDTGAGGESWAGARVDNSTSRAHSTVYGCARFIADGISTLPVDVYRRQGDRAPVEVRPPAWLTRPTPDLDLIAWVGQLLWSLLLAGNAFVRYDWAEGGLVSMVPLDPDSVTVNRVRGRKVFTIGGQQVNSTRIGHIAGPMWPGTDVGMSPVEAARQTIGIGMSAQEYAARFFGQGASLSGVIEVPGQLEDTKAKQLARSWARAHSGKSKSHLPGVLEGGATWKPTGITNEQAQFLESRKFTAAQIASEMFLIDPTEMGYPVEGSSLTYANLEQRNARKVQVTFLPWIRRIENFLSALLPQPQYVKFNVDALLRGDTKTRFDAYRVALGPDIPFMGVDQVRELEDWPALPPEGT